MKRELIECLCSDCGINHQVYYDSLNDHYICQDCLNAEEEEDEDEEEDLQREEEIYRIKGDN